jgi:hypothetical protein
MSSAQLIDFLRGKLLVSQQKFLADFWIVSHVFFVKAVILIFSRATFLFQSKILIYSVAEVVQHGRLCLYRTVKILTGRYCVLDFNC